MLGEDDDDTLGRLESVGCGRLLQDTILYIYVRWMLT
jgi:hypothetical protein